MPNETNDFDISFTSQTSDGTIIVTSAEEIGKEKTNKLYPLKDGDKIKIGSYDSKYDFQFLVLK